MICGAPTRSFGALVHTISGRGTRLDRLAQQRFGRHVIQLAIRWLLDQGITTALWGGHPVINLSQSDEVTGWWVDAPAKAEVDRILRETITDPVGLEFMAPPARSVAGITEEVGTLADPHRAIAT